MSRFSSVVTAALSLCLWACGPDVPQPPAAIGSAESALTASVTGIPVIAAVSPVSGSTAGGTFLGIFGFNFTNTTKVYIGVVSLGLVVPVTASVTLSPNLILAQTP